MADTTLEQVEQLVNQLTPDDQRLLAQNLMQRLSQQPQNITVHSGSDIVAYWKHEKLIGTRSDIINSQMHARHLRSQAEKRLKT